MRGRLECVRYCLDNGCPRSRGGSGDAIVFLTALGLGELPLLQLLHERGVGLPLRAEYASRGAEYGGLPVLQWLRAQGCPWDYETNCAAATSGRLDALRWAVANGCDFDPAARRACYLRLDDRLRSLEAEGRLPLAGGAGGTEGRDEARAKREELGRVRRCAAWVVCGEEGLAGIDAGRAHMPSLEQMRAFMNRGRVRARVTIGPDGVERTQVLPPDAP